MGWSGRCRMPFTVTARAFGAKIRKVTRPSEATSGEMIDGGGLGAAGAAAGAGAGAAEAAGAAGAAAGGFCAEAQAADARRRAAARSARDQPGGVNSGRVM